MELYGNNIHIIYCKLNWNFNYSKFKWVQYLGKGDEGEVNEIKHKKSYVLKQFHDSQCKSDADLQNYTKNHLIVEELGYANVLYCSFSSEYGYFMIFEKLEHKINKADMIKYKDILMESYNKFISMNIAFSDLRDRKSVV